MNEILLSIITEARHWEDQLFENEKKEMTYNNARRSVIERIYKKYEDKLITAPADHSHLIDQFKEFLNSKNV